MNIWRINMRLLVASSHRFDVDAIGDIQLITTEGPLIVRGVLFCKDIPGVVLSIGHLISQKISVEFINNQFTLHQNSHTYHTFYRNSRWYLKIESYVPRPMINTISVVSNSPPPPISFMTKPRSFSFKS
ncbi:hypothetical protein O181_087621 [Austropuccinia psidii MF-1]|uniref:Uncharacterized protein n=1 Tax=Austropuccinia psidii MF-1 TaxID=1389203 RepID=A0A9Q3IQ02_9BASI|nr:hypothetical protein [Austropuccinia psidii MF-1]